MSPDDPSPPAQQRPLSHRKELVTAWLLLLLDGDATYGYELRRKLDVHRFRIDAASVYRALRKLESDGWVESRWMKSVAGPRRRFYRLTARGRRRLQEVASLIAATRDSYNAFLSAFDAHEPRAQATSAAADSAKTFDSSS